MTPRVKRQVLLLLGAYYPGNHIGIARYAREAGWVLNNTYAHNGLVPVWWRGDGILSLITHPKDYTAYKQLPRLPMVDISKGWVTNAMPRHLRASGRNCPRVVSDNPGIGRLAAEHFIERGYRHVAFLNLGNYWMETERKSTFRAEIEAVGIAYHEIPYYKHFSMSSTTPGSSGKSAYHWLMEEIRRLPKPLGVFGGGDDISLLLMSACLDAGFRIPEEVAVLGCNNMAIICDFAPVPLSSVDPDLERQGYAAAQLLDQLMNGEPPPREPIIIPPKGVTTRQSTNILAVPHVNVARALRFIWEHHHEPIQASDVVAATGLSRRALERAFSTHIHHSIADEITQRRVEHAKQLLLTTNLKAHEVAEQSGFSGMVHFSQVFLRVTGTRPSHYRRETPREVL